MATFLVQPLPIQSSNPDFKLLTFRKVKVCFQTIAAGVDFINILRAAFTDADLESTKKDYQVVSLFCDFGICACKSCL